MFFTAAGKLMSSASVNGILVKGLLSFRHPQSTFHDDPFHDNPQRVSQKEQRSFCTLAPIHRPSTITPPQME